jgi:omega-amidase
MRKLKIALCQLNVVDNKQANLNNIQYYMDSVLKEPIDIIVFPEMCTCPYDISKFHQYAESQINSETLDLFQRYAKKYQLMIVGGSIPEIDQGKIYNTSYVIDQKGVIIGKHRKLHLFDIQMKNGINFRESSVLSPGNDYCLFETPWGKAGVCICYDIRFPELIRLMALEGAKMIFVPAAFNMTTGPLHWETLFKSRALDNQIYIFGVSSATNIQLTYQAYGHSIIVNPMGQIVTQLGFEEGVILTDIELDEIEEARSQIPIYQHRRNDLYNLTKNINSPT